MEARRAAAQEATAQNTAAAPNTTTAQNTSSSTLPTINVVGVSPMRPPPPQRKPASSSRAAANARGTANGSAAPSEAATITHAEPGVVDRDKVPSNIQTMSAPDFDHTVTPSLLDAISRALPGVALSDQTGNPFQLDLNYRGFIASPVIGTPQGIAVYQNGVRINEVFGDIVNWDFIPENAINQMTMVPSNPIYGLNAIGGAMTFDMKNGFTYQGISGEV
ncbi:MAG TPA: Plug domain-containing protein, partial [Beijerinckiaceae bacterium]|nr:Plug domain-containing protein [Beijerinckiaceae bacterium]